MEKREKQFIADKVMQEWVKDNKELLDDYRELCTDLLLFRAKWGIEIGFVFKNPELKKKLGGGYSPTGITEELFDAQKAVNKIEDFRKDKFRNTP